MTRRAAFLLAIALAASIAVDAIAEHEPVPAPLVTPISSGTSLSCPLAVDAASRSFVHLANVASKAARVKLTVAGANAKSFTTSFALGPGTVKTVRVSARTPGRAAALIEATGGEITASHSVWFRAQRRIGLLQRLVHPRGGGAAPCRASGPGELVLPHLTTLDGDTRLALFNPGAATAQVSLSLIVGNRVVRPERLQERGIAPRAVRVFSLGGFVFNADEVTAVVHQGSGRVVAEALVVTRSGVSLVGGTEATAGPLTIAGATGAGASLGLTALGSADAGIAASVLGRNDQGRARGIPPDLAPETGARRRAPAVDGGGPAAFHLAATVGGPLAFGARWRVARAGVGDLEAAGQLEPGRRWAAVFGSVVPGATARVLIANPGQSAVRVRLRRLGGGQTQDLSVPGGRLRAVPFAETAATGAIVIDAEQPVAVLVQAIVLENVGGLRTAYGFALEGSRLDRPGSVPLIVDPRAGVPAPLPA